MMNRFRTRVAVCFAVVCACVAAAPATAFARTSRIPDVPTRTLVDGVTQWQQEPSGEAGESAQITRGSRKDTVKVTRVINVSIKGKRSGMNLNVRKRVSLRYEVYSAGPRKGEVYRVYKPSVTVVEKSCRYFFIFRLSPRIQTSLIDYGATPRGRGVASFTERATYTLPRQFPIRRDMLSELLRSAFHIDEEPHTTTYTIVPAGAFGAVNVTY